MTDSYSNTADPGGGGGVAPDVVVTDQQLFDSAISNPEPQQQPQRQEPQQQVQPSPQLDQQQRPQQPQQHPGPQPRNAQGQFAPRQQPRPQQPPQGGPTAQQGQDAHRVPLRELLDERERRYQLQAERDQMRNAWAQMQYQAEQQRLAQEAQQRPQTIYDNPDAYLMHNVIAPLRQQMQMENMQQKDMMSREFANAQFGEQTVNAALQAMAQIRHTPDGNHVYNQIMGSGHPYGALIRWFNVMRAQQQIGPDPVAWMRRQHDAWMNDPRVQAEVMKRATAASQQQRQRNGGPPNVQLPPSLSSLPASSGRGDQMGDMSDASLYRFATR